jgi:hypothetical protein
VYGEQAFPLQVAVLLAEPGRDFAGGEFILTEQRPRMQSRAQVVSLFRGAPWCSLWSTDRRLAPAVLTASISGMVYPTLSLHQE